MNLPVGKRLGPYEVIGPLGAGGMGEVYRARDPRLGRDVAIKVLPAALAADPERLKRFEREARSASSLNHPNIITIYDIGSSEGVSFIAMELVTGESLRAHLESRALPVREILKIGAQIAEGLSRAHASGIVHRDLKPENVMMTEDGLVKILDFGLAKLTQPEASASAATVASTVSGATQEGIILGTVGYMSPEQAMGKPLDYRSDQFSLGSILYEMATGRRTFQRASTPQTLAAIIQEEPEPIGNLNPKIPVPLRWIAERCLAKAPRDRYASTEDLARDLTTVRDRLSESTSGAAVSAEPLPSAKRRRFGVPTAFALGLLVAVIGGAAWRLTHLDDLWRNPLAGARFTRFTDWEGSESDASISPDGRFVAFLSDRDGRFDAWIGQVGSGEFRNLTKGQFPELISHLTRNVGFSWDSAHVWVRVTKGGGQAVDTWFVPTIGGTARLFLPGAVSLDWTTDRSRIVYHTSEPGDPIFVADANARNPRQVSIETKGTHDHFPTWSQDGRFIYFVQWIHPKEDMDIWRISAEGGKPERVTSHHASVSHPTFLDARTLVYCAARPDGSGKGLWGLDVARRKPHLLTASVEEYRSVAASADGRRLVAAVANPVHNLWTVPVSDHIVDQEGVQRFRVPTMRAGAPRFGPGYILYLASKGGADGLWKFKDGSETELWKGSDGPIPVAPTISPDGSRICFVVRGQRASLHVMAADGTDARPLAESLDVADSPSWSPDGKWIAVVANEGKASPLFNVPVEGGPPVRLAEGLNSNPVWSPDGRFILYSEYDRSSLNRLRGITPDKKPVAVPDVRVRFQGNRYRFLPDGKSVVVMQGELYRQDFWILDLSTGRLRQLTNLGRAGPSLANFDVSPDGKTILFDGYRENSDIVLIDLPPHS